ncbi:HTH domain-containing protein [Candidatus Uhrbacteria bacterium]|nr:HTH domain-containing protein [Candidatus Uhrbacteria bacterium]
MTNLNSRQKELLARIVRHYVDRAEPVSSGQLAQEFNLSPATLRNEMSELERLGYIYQPHTSAGRIPAEAAFRFYISEYVKEKEPNKKAKDELKTACHYRFWPKRSVLHGPDEFIYPAGIS